MESSTKRFNGTSGNSICAATLSSASRAAAPADRFWEVTKSSEPEQEARELRDWTARNAALSAWKNRPIILNPDIQTTKHHESQGVPNCAGLIHQMSAKIVTNAFSFLLFVLFVASHFPPKDHSRTLLIFGAMDGRAVTWDPD